MTVADDLARVRDAVGTLMLPDYEALAALDRVEAEIARLERDRLWVNERRTVLVRLWANGTVEVATRETPDHTWGPPVYLTEETT